MRKSLAILSFLALASLWVVSDGAPPQTKRVYDLVYGTDGTPLKGAGVRVELQSPDSTKVSYDSTSGASLGKNPPPFDTTTDANGYYAVRLIPNTTLIPHGSRYRVTVTWGRRVVYSVSITVGTADSARTRSLQ